jgi:hypothetical protein
MSESAPAEKPRWFTKDLVTVVFDNERIVYDPRHGRAHYLNSTLTCIWQRCDGSRTLEELAASISQQSGGGDMIGLVGRGLTLLAKANLLESSSFNPNQVRSRRLRRRAPIEEPRIVSITTPKGRREWAATVESLISRASSGG